MDAGLAKNTSRRRAIVIQALVQKLTTLLEQLKTSLLWDQEIQLADHIDIVVETDCAASRRQC